MCQKHFYLLRTASWRLKNLVSFEYPNMTSMLMCHQEGGKRSSTFLNMQILSSQMVLCQTVSKCLLWTENNFMSREFIQSYKPLKTCGYNEVHH